jgi:putative transposase
VNVKRAMIQPENPELSVRKQCELLQLPRSTYTYVPTEPSHDTLALMRAIDELAMTYPFWGSRNVVLELRSRGWAVNRKRVQRLRRAMQIESIAPKPSTSTPNKQHEKYPYLLRNLPIVRPNQVWATDITYIPLAHGFAYLVAIIDWYSRKVLSWRLSNTMDDAFCVDALEDALQKFGAPEIFNSDQGSQFTSDDFTGALKAGSVRISMDGKGRWVDNVFVERLWRSMKYEDVYIRCYATISEARAGIAKYLQNFNTTRRHQGLGNDTPDAVYFRDALKIPSTTNRQTNQPVTFGDFKIAA